MLIHEKAKQGKMSFLGSGNPEVAQFWEAGAVGMCMAAVVTSPVDAQELVSELLPGAKADEGEREMDEWSLHFENVGRVLPNEELVWVEYRLKCRNVAVLFTKMGGREDSRFDLIVGKHELPAESQSIMDITVATEEGGSCFLACNGLVALGQDGQYLAARLEFPKVGGSNQDALKVGAEVALYVGLTALQRINEGRMFVFPAMGSALVQ